MALDVLIALDGVPLPPKIFSFSPKAGPVRTKVTIIGQGFTGATVVTFNGKRATRKAVLSDARITATVPKGAKTGFIKVTAPLGVAASATRFRVTGPRAVIKKLRPAKCRRGATLTITGKNFGARRGRSSVLFGSAKCKKYLSWSKTRITCKVPKAAKIGRVAVTIKTVAGTSRAKYVKVRR